jgi:gamma-glutamyltranspeptidase/glutathione hydrolase
MLNMLEPYDLKKNPWSSIETTHLVAEAMKRAFCERAKHLGDPDFVTIPKHLLTKEHAKKLMESFDLAKATPSATLAPELDIKDGGPSTTHFSIVDKDGMCVSNTYTIENPFGCRVVVRGAGFILNNEMTDFNHKPGTTTKTGMIGTDANIIAPGKRMLSSMTPVIVLKDGQPVLVTGSPGGRTIINTVASVLLNTIDYRVDLRKAVDAPRLHMQWFPDRIQLEDREGMEDLLNGLKSKGHTVMKIQQGDSHSIWIDPKTRLRTGAADKRLSGSAVGED